jgi:hypothetical protein
MEGGADIVLAADTANHIVEFVEPSPRPEANQSTTRNDVLSSRENADGSVDIVIGRGQLDNATVFHIPQSEREGGFTGDKTLGVATSMSYVLDFSDIERNYYARLIDDVNGDGKADIFLQSDGLPTKGIIFGDDSRLNSEITASFDIEIRQPIDFGTRNLEPLGFKKVPDLDSDGVDDFMIVRVSRITFLSGAALQDPTLSILDLEQLSSSQGFSIPIVPSSFRFADVISTSDFDGDGFPSLLFIARGAGGSGSGLSLVDGDDFIALASTPTGDAFGQAIRTIGPNPGTYQEAMLLIGDRTGDGIDDLLVFDGNFGDDIELISGTAIRDALNDDAPSNQIFSVPDTDVLKIEIERFSADASAVAAQPVWFTSQDLIALGSVCSNDLFSEPCAGIGLFQAAEFNAAIESSATGLKFRSAKGLPF